MNFRTLLSRRRSRVSATAAFGCLIHLFQARFPAGAVDAGAAFSADTPARFIGAGDRFK